MGLFDGIENDSKTRYDRCSVTRVRAALPPEDVAGFDAAMAAPKERVSGSDIARRLRTAGFDITGPAVARHRRGDCKCSA
jgi:hypothetical protein